LKAIEKGFDWRLLKVPGKGFGRSSLRALGRRFEKRRVKALEVGVAPRAGPRVGRRWEIAPWCVSCRKVGPKGVGPNLSDASTAPARSKFVQTECWILRRMNT